MNALVGPATPPVTRPSALRRYREVAAVFVRHGLADVVSVLGLGRYLAWGMRALPRRFARIDASLSRAARFRLALEELGPTFVKFGQALSVRADVLPPDVVSELTKLQEQVPSLDPGVAETAVETAFGQPIASLFQSFDPAPLAAASIAQVHRAVLSSGEAVVVKIRRPGIGPVIAGDIELLRQLARLVERHVPAAALIDPTGLVDEFARTIRAEQDLVREGRTIEQFARNFATDPTVRLPRVYWDRTTQSVLTLEWLDGLKVADLDGAGVGPFRRRRIARHLADAMLVQVLAHGLFHADPHPGNLVVLPDDVIGFLDLGIVGRLDDRSRSELAHVIHAIARRDASALTAAVLEFAEPLDDVDAHALERDLSGLIETYGHMSLGDLSFSELSADIFGTAAKHKLRIPSNLMLLIKAFVIVEGVGLGLDPSFRMVEHAAPLAGRLWRDHAQRLVTRGLRDTLRSTVEAVRSMPVHVEVIARKIREGRLEIRFVHRNLDHLVGEMDRSSNRLAFAMIIAALIVGSSLIIQAGRGAVAYGYPVLGLAGYLIAGVFGIRLAIGIMRSGRL